jgi:hypothetical protein
MENLIIGISSITPQVNFQTNGSMLIKGVSQPGDVSTFYQPVINWLEDFKYNKPAAEVNLILDIDYLNTASTKIFVKILALVNSISQGGVHTKVTWRYDEGDEDMLELGKDLAASSQCVLNYLDIKKS